MWRFPGDNGRGMADEDSRHIFEPFYPEGDAKKASAVSN
jgi:signal transduction histidine kinase